MPDAMEYQLRVPPELAAGSYANLLIAWHTPHECTLDFCVTLPPGQEDEGSPPPIPCQVVARLKVPVTVLFDMLQTINGIMTRYEERFGPIRRLGEEPA